MLFVPVDSIPKHTLYEEVWLGCEVLIAVYKRIKVFYRYIHSIGQCRSIYKDVWFIGL